MFSTHSRWAVHFSRTAVYLWTIKFLSDYDFSFFLKPSNYRNDGLFPVFNYSHLLRHCRSSTILCSVRMPVRILYDKMYWTRTAKNCTVVGLDGIRDSIDSAGPQYRFTRTRVAIWGADRAAGNSGIFPELFCFFKYLFPDNSLWQKKKRKKFKSKLYVRGLENGLDAYASEMSKITLKCSGRPAISSGFVKQIFKQYLTPVTKRI